MRAVDTNILVRLIVRDELRQVAAAEAFVAAGAWVSHLVLAETVWVLDAVHELAAARIATAIDMLLAHETLTLQDADVVAGALRHYRERPALGFSDCLVLEIARKAGHLPLGTFDRRLGGLPDAERQVTPSRRAAP
jgi:predicted nucleic-acid-binding protein